MHVVIFSKAQNVSKFLSILLVYKRFYMVTFNFYSLHLLGSWLTTD